MTAWTALAREPMIPWNRIKDSWSSSWKALDAKGLQAYRAMIVRTPEAFRPTVEAFLTELHATRRNIERMVPKLQQLSPGDRAHFEPVVVSLLTRWRTLAAGVLADAKPSVQGAPVVLIVVGVVIGIAAIAWSVSAYQYSVNLREQTALAEKELDARVLASQQGRLLPPTTLPQPSSGLGTTGWLLVAGLVVGAVAVGPTLLKQVAVTS